MPERVQKNAAFQNGMCLTGTQTRVRDVAPISGLCALCVRECPFLCEVSLSSFRGREVLYPVTDFFGRSTAGSLKDYRLDWSDFNIMAALRGAQGIAADSDIALFENADISTSVGGIPLKLPIIAGAFGSTMVGKVNWDGLAVGCALAGASIVIGENVCGMDPTSKFSQGKIVSSEDMEHRINKYRELWDGKHGEVVVQTNVEDARLGVDEYVLSKLEVNVIERKWGQGAKAIGGEVRLRTLKRAKLLKERGYVVIPDPSDPTVEEAFKAGVFTTFERHSRVGMPNKRDFIDDVEWLRSQGARVVTIKTGAYRPSAVAWTMKVASEAKIDYITFDGAGGGTGMSPVPMMNEMSTPTIYLEAQVLKCARLLKEKNRHVPDICMAGGFINESQIYKSIAMSNFGEGPFVKGIVMARAPLTSVMKCSYFETLRNEGKLPQAFTRKYGNSPEQYYVTIPALNARYGAEKVKQLPWPGIGLYTYLNERIGVGLKQLLAGSRKFKLDLIDRADLAALSERASKVTEVPLLENLDLDQIVLILN
ncbi:MAG: FMN-binding glutamate synthase family protein [Candidatus Bathyarchaeota archaeon]|nr:MAG: FMN-binding glutamate synthase family protein [Candidatus Bathyarchaeota archaeon]